MRLWILNITGVAVLIAGYSYILPLFTDDTTYMTWGMGCLFFVGVYFALEGRWRAVEYISGILPLLGLLGTVIGIRMAVSGATGDNFALRDFGIDTALNTTIMGVVGSLWLGLNGKLK